jgi:hypothetical protein
MRWFAVLSLVVLGVSSALAAAPSAAPSRVEFNRDIRPILSDNCFYCHGPDPKHREADLRLDLRDAATAERDGSTAIVPGKPEASALVERITSADADVLMPPPDSNKKLTPRQIDLLRRWIAEGAEYQSHWAYAPLAKPQPPELTDAADRAWARNDVDRFIAARLRREGLPPAAEADPRTLVRRLSFDLTGLPPTPEVVDAFAVDHSDKAYEALVDKLLASPHYGERMAAWWLDLVRYADTVGYHGDQNVTVWPFRDYVIEAFNADLPFDRFTTEQLAGDLLPEPTREQRIAAGYNRLGMMTAEGGAQAKEYLAKYAAERVRNASNTWLGSTLGCAECHDHKFDPFTTRDFYSFAAFFADIKEQGVYTGASRSGAFGPQLLLTTPEQEAELARMAADIKSLQAEIDKASIEAKKQFTAWDNEHREAKATDDEKLPKDIVAILRETPNKRSQPNKDKLYAYFLDESLPELAAKTKQVKKLEAQRTKYEDTIPSMLVVERVPPREMRVLPRGNWMDDSGDVVVPAVPEFLPQPPTGNANKRLTRLDLARWTTSNANPLTPRVFANRLWAMFFGVGLSKRLDDLGAQGEPPVHPELLDHLAAKFRDGWSFKRTIKEIVLSTAYRQSSIADASVVAADPDNRLNARQSRFRLPAESVRDAALAASGLLVRTVGGRSVRPYQPAGYYAQLNFPKREYEVDTGENLWRRSVYTHWQRTFLHPAMVAFDAPSREECTCERVRSNTPLQSLVLLNDPEFVEAARSLAERVIREGEAPAEPRVNMLFRLALQRSPSPDEVKLLTALVEKHRQEYVADRTAAESLINIGERPAATDLRAPELAAWTSAARVALNLHEFVTRE